MHGAIGIENNILSPSQLSSLKTRLTVKSIPFKNQPSTVVEAYYEYNNYIWIPRYFDKDTYWPNIQSWNWVCPKLDYNLQQLMTPDANRKQPEAIAALSQALNTHHATIGVLPTSAGKTMVALTTASQFKTPIGVFIYAGHMIDNWIEHAKSVLGIPEHDVGIVKENRCDIGKPLTIISVQTALSRELPPELLNSIGFIILDECHHYAARSWHRVLFKFPAKYRLGISANPTREDGLDPIIRWNFGNIGFSCGRGKTKLPMVCLTKFDADYPKNKYFDWKKVDDKWELDTPNSMKYDRLLKKDTARNEWLIDKIVEARAKERTILIFARHRDHVSALHNMYLKKYSELKTRITYPDTKILVLWGGTPEAERKAADKAHVIFTTHGYSREALNLTHIDTLIFATPPGNPLQPAGRIRDKGSSDRKPPLIVDPFETNDFSVRKANRRKTTYESLGMIVKRFESRPSAE